MNIQELQETISKANEAYRTGEAIMSDEQYDELIEKLQELDPNNDLLNKVGINIDDDRKQKLPIPMASMNKIKTIGEFEHWVDTKGISRQNRDFVITPKYDGISLCVVENTQSAWTRGDGTYGQRSDNHFKKMNTNFLTGNMVTFGEVIMPRKVFEEKYSKDFRNPRNLVAGALNTKEPTNILNDCDYVRYGIETNEFSFELKSEALDFLNSTQKTPTPYEVVSYQDISEDYLKSLFEKWAEKYEIDGLIIEVDSEDARKKLGRETSTNNPCYARAYKGEFEEVKQTTVKGITWNISKQGYLKPTIHVDPIELDGVTVSNVTGNNARFVKDMGIGEGSIIEVKRSGMVIPVVTKVIEPKEFQLPDIEHEIKWNDNKIELITVGVTDDQKLKQIISFFKILGVDNVSEGVCKQFFEAGYDTIKKILSMSKQDMMSLDRFGERKSEIIHNSIHSKMKDVKLSKLQHASGLFKGLGSKKLLLLESLDNPTHEQICSIDGFSDISAKHYLESIDKFNEFMEDLNGLVNVTKTEVVEAESSDLEGMAFVFSGVRRKDLNEIIESKGGRVATGVSKNTTHLVMKKTGTGTTKEKKALKYGQKIMTVEELEQMLK